MTAIAFAHRRQVLRWCGPVAIGLIGSALGKAMLPTDTAPPHNPQPFFFSGCRCVNDLVPGSAQAPTIALLGALCWLLISALGCGRTQLEPASPTDAGTKIDRPMDLGADLPQDQARDLLQDQMDAPIDVGGPTCVPAPEECNGRDDDCNGKIDEAQPEIPCPNGGVRRCVGGTYSTCPVRCEVCIPKSERICFRTFCTYWGTQICSADGYTFGPCMEAPVPRECEKIAKDKMRSRELEMCCLANNYCCRDEYDLDGDGDTGEMLGRCEQVICTP
jgi:hypothetical protein